MSITTINDGISGNSFRTQINQNFENLNADKAETSALTSGLATKQATLVSGINIKTVNGNSLLVSGDIVISGGGVTDDGALTGLTDDDHTQYTKADGTRAFTGKQSYATHPTFSADTELVDKKYVDDSITAGGGYTDEQAQDAVGTILVDSSTIDFVYNDATPSITGSVIDGSIGTIKLGGDITAVGKALLDDATVAAQRTTLGLGNVDNTSDANKPISTATQTALNAKENTISVGTTAQYYRGDKTFQTLNSSSVGLGNVDNTSDATKNSATATITNKDLSSTTNTYRSASLTQIGAVELATTAEINTGTDSTRAMPIDQYVASNRNIRHIDIYAVEKATDNAVGTNIIGAYEIPIAGTIVDIGAYVETAGVTGVSIWDVNNNGTTLMTTNKLSIDSGETSTRTAVTAPTLTTTSVAVGDLITIDTDSLSTTKPKGLHIRLSIRLS